MAEFWAKNTFFHLMPSQKFLKILQRIGLNHGKAHVKLFQWYIFGLGAIGKSLSLIRPIFHFPIIFLIILSHNLFSNVHVHMFIFSLTHGRLQLTLWVKFWFPYDLFGLAAPLEKITPRYFNILYGTIQYCNLICCRGFQWACIGFCLIWAIFIHLLGVIPRRVTCLLIFVLGRLSANSMLSRNVVFMQLTEKSLSKFS